MTTTDVHIITGKMHRALKEPSWVDPKTGCGVQECLNLLFHIEDQTSIPQVKTACQRAYALYERRCKMLDA